MQSRSFSEVARSAVAAGLPYDVTQLQAWLEPLANKAQVECDGMTRLASHLLHKNGVEHIVAGGMLVDMQRLQDPEVGTEQNCGVTHWWLELGFGYRGFSGQDVDGPRGAARRVHPCRRQV